MNTLSETGEPDRTPLPEDLMTRESYVESCLALFEDLKTKIIDALIRGVRVSLSHLRKRFLSRYVPCSVLGFSLCFCFVFKIGVQGGGVGDLYFLLGGKRRGRLKGGGVRFLFRREKRGGG